MSSPAGDAAALQQACRDFVQGSSAPTEQQDAAAIVANDYSVDEVAANSALTQLMLALHGKRATLKDIVVASGFALTSESSLQRRRGVLLLAELLTRLPTLPLDDQAVQTFVGFFTARLSDEKCWKETLLGLSALVQHRPLAAPQHIQIFKSIFDHVAVQTMTQSGRKLALDLLLRIGAVSPEGSGGSWGIHHLWHCPVH